MGGVHGMSVSAGRSDHRWPVLPWAEAVGRCRAQETGPCVWHSAMTDASD